MNFTYTGASQGTWNSSTHEYTGGTEGGWTADTKTITVTNHSNVAVNATLAFNASADGVTGTFTETSGTENDNVLELATAVGTASTDAPSATANFGIGGAAITENKDLGTITVTIAKNGPTVVTTYEQLAAAVKYGGNIELGAEIDMGANKLTLASGTQGTIDLGGYKINTTGYDSIIINSGAEYTIKNGTIETSNMGFAIDNNGTVTIEQCTLNSNGYALRSGANAHTTVTSSSLNGNAAAIMIGGDNSSVIISGNVTLNGASTFTTGYTRTITILPGTYNFDPSSYDTGSYTVAKTGSTWTVA